MASLGLSHHNNPNSTSQETNVGILPAVEYVSSNYEFQNWVILVGPLDLVDPLDLL